jgi:ABC-type iron transport system FetAB ATPase subunit
MATRLNRWAATQAVLNLVRQHELLTSAVSVTATFPGDQIRSEAIWAETIEGEIQWPVMQAGRRQFDDFFDITLAIRTANQRDENAAMTRTEELTAAVIEALQELPTLLELDGIVSAEVTSAAMFAAETKTVQFVGRAEVTVSIHSRIL